MFSPYDRALASVIDILAKADVPNYDITSSAILPDGKMCVYKIHIERRITLPPGILKEYEDACFRNAR